MDRLITFAYTGKITLTEDNVESLIIDVDYLQLTDIKQECEKFLMSILRVANVYKIHQLAVALSCSSLKEESYKFMRLNIRNLAQTEDFFDFDFSLLTDVLISNDLRHTIFSPSQLFGIIVKWLANKFNDRKIHLSELMQCDNFSALTFKDLYSYIYKDEIVAKLSRHQHSDLLADIFLHQSFEKHEEKNDVVYNRCCNQAKGRMIVVKFNWTSFIAIYDPYTGDWGRIIIKKPTTIQCGTLHEGRMYLFTGEFIRFYEFKDKTWGEMRNMQSRSMSTDANIAGLDGYLYMYDGNTWSMKFSRLCLRTQLWEDRNPPHKFYLAATIITFRKHIYAIGGHVSNQVECYDPEADKWTIIPQMQSIRDWAAAAAFNEKIYVCGGYLHGLGLKSVEFYDPETDRWEYAAPMNEARHSFLLVALAGKLWAIGGLNVETGESIVSTEVYDPVKNLWSLIPSDLQYLGRVFGGVLFNALQC